MKNDMNLFKETNGEYSWRKIMTASCVVIFLIASIGFLVKHNFDELPASYQAIVSGVFIFYFGKRFFENLKITNNGG
jgi:uncharacterized membrane protein